VKTKKTLVVAAICFPPVLIGPAILMGNLFRHFPKGSYHVLMGRLDYALPRKDEDSRLPAHYTYARVPWLNSKGDWRRRIRSKLRFLSALLEFTWKGLKIIRREEIDTIFVVADYHVELAALLMHWITGKKIVLWLPDVYYIPENLKGWTRFVGRIIEPFLLRAVDTALVTGGPTQDYYQERYGLKTTVLLHSVDLNKYTGFQQPARQEKKVTDILFTGSVTLAQRGAILDMVRVVNEFPELDARLIVVSIESPHSLEEMGIAGPRVVCRQADREYIRVLQRSSDIHFLPLAFECHGMNHRIIVRTASPSKLPEYLAAGRPILVYAPPDSYYARYAREEGFGLVVDQPDPDLLHQAILKLQSDTSLCEQLVSNARRVAKEHHNSVKVSFQLQNLLKKG
jgi:glycosyltransferase involved in cell wall biosynthesis